MLALNKVDVEGVPQRLEEIKREFAEALAEHGDRLGRPHAVVSVSAVTGENTQELLKARCEVCVVFRVRTGCVVLSAPCFVFLLSV